MNPFSSNKGAAPKAAPTVEELKPVTIQVKATAKGWYRSRRIEEGDVFFIEPEAFSKRWMEKVEIKE